MVYRRRKRTYRPRRRYGRRFKRRSYRRTMFKRKFRYGGSGFPPRLDAKLQYTSIFNNSGSGTYDSDQVFRGNSVYDPDYTGGGLQPAGFDDFAAIYKSYVVRGCKIIVTARTETTSATFTPTTVIVANSDPGGLEGNSTADLYVQPKHKVMFHGATGSAGALRKASMYIRTSQFYNIRDDTNSNVTSNPAAEWYFHIVTKGVTAADQIRYDVKLKYYVTFFERQDSALD